MKNSIYFLPLILLVLAACARNSETSLEDLIARGDLEALKARKKELFDQQTVLNARLKQIDSVIGAREGNGKIPLVSTLVIHPAQFDHYLELQGDVQTKQNILLYPEMPGTLIQVLVKEGDRVQKGQLLARIDDGGMASGLQQLRTQAALASTTFERQKRLWEQNIGSEIQYLQAKTNYEASVNMVEQAEAQLAKASIRAPFGGIIDDVMLDQGSTVNPAAGVPVFRLVNLGEMYVAIDVPESYLESVRPGKEVMIYLPVLGDSIHTHVRQASNFINPTNRSFSVEVPVPNQSGRVKPNLTARVRINDYSNEKALLIPPMVISENAEGEQYVYVAVEIGENRIGKAEKRVITTGRSQGNDVEVLSGIAPGEQIITEGARRIREGQEIEIIEGV
ncbi:MAG TPA: efflux RND transporter periplasmic adaptor subunit [Robiginitalea sp.]|nr:efflux RND transporter periplasmic adaptor subunit [Robiginitalea sp.]